MRRLFLFEIKNIFSRNEIKLIFIIFLFCSSFNFIATCYFMYGLPQMGVRSNFELAALKNPIDMFISDGYKVFFPLLVALIYSDSQFIENKNNISIFINTRTNINKLIIVRFILIFFTTVIVATIPLLFNYLLNLITFPSITADLNQGVPSYTLFSYDHLNNLKKSGDLVGILDYIYVYNPHYYNIILIILKSISGGAFSVMAYAISFYVKKSRLIVILSSYLICLIGVYMPEIFSFFNIELIYTADIYLISDYIVTCLILILVSYISITFSIKKGLIYR